MVLLRPSVKIAGDIEATWHVLGFFVPQAKVSRYFFP